MFGLDDRQEFQIDQTSKMSTNESTMSSRLVRKQKQLRDVRHVYKIVDVGW